MPYGELRVDTITFTNGGVDTSITVSGLAASTTGNLTVTGTVSGTAANFVSGAFSTRVSGLTVAGTTGTFTSLTGTTFTATTGTFTTVTGGIVTITSGVFASGSATNPSISFVGDGNTGIYASAADQVSITTSGTERLRIDAAGQIESVSLGTAAAPAYSFTTDPNTGIYSPGADQLAISTNGTGRLFVDASGNVGVGVSSPQHPVHIDGTSGAVQFRAGVTYAGTGLDIKATENSDVTIDVNDSTKTVARALVFSQAGSERMRLDSSGRLGLGTSSPAALFHVVGTGLFRASIAGTAAPLPAESSSVSILNGTAYNGIPSVSLNIGAQNFDAVNNNTSFQWRITTPSTALAGTSLQFSTYSFDGTSTYTTTPRVVIDGSGRLLVGTSTARTNFDNANDPVINAPALQLEGVDNYRRISVTSCNAGAAGSHLILAHQRSGTVGGNTILNDADVFGAIQFQGSDGSELVIGATILAVVDGTPGANDMPGRLVFSTTADGASSPTERMRIDSSGRVGIGTTSPSVDLHVSNASGARIRAGGAVGAGFEFNDANTRLDIPAANTIAVYTGASERARIDSSGRLLVGTSTSVAVAGGNNLIQTFSNTSDRPLGTHVGINGTFGPNIMLSKSRNTTFGSFTVVQSGDVLGTIQFAGDDGTDYASVGAQIAVQVDGTPGANDMPGRLVFSTTPDGASSPTERMRITSAGNVGIGTTSPSQPLHVAGNALIGGSPTTQYSTLSVLGDAALYAASPLLNFVNATASTRFAYITHTGTGGDLYLLNQETGALRFGTNNAERARIDSSGRLLVGTSTARSNFFNSTLSAAIQIEGVGHNPSSLSLVRNNTTGGAQFPPNLVLASSGGTAVGSNTLSIVDGQVGTISFQGADGTEFVEAAQIRAEIDGTPGANDMPGRLVFSTTADGASSPTERLRITNDGVKAYDQLAPAAVNATATLTVTNLKTGIITSTSAAATDMTLPTGTDTQAGFSGTYDNMTFEWSVINTGPSLVRVLAGTAHTIVGSGSVATGTSGRFASRRTANNTFVTYRLS
jgi:hypothetical protein